MTRLWALASHRADRLNSVGLPYLALDHLESGTGRLVKDAELQPRPDSQTVRAQPGDVLFGKLRPYLHKVFLVEDDVVCSGELMVLQPNARILSRFLYYLALSDLFVGWASATSYGVKMPRTNWEALRELRVSLPQLTEQRQIADYLDAETGRIDALIAANHRMQALVEERLDSAVFRFTTRGISTAPDLVPSGLNWTRDVPGSWSVEPIGARFSVQLGKMLNAAAASGPDQREYLRNTNVQWWRVDLSDVATMSFPPRARDVYRLAPGDLLVCEGGEVGRAAVWEGELEECYFQKAVHRLRARGDDEAWFLAYVLRAMAKTEVFRVEGNQSTIVHLTAEQLRGRRVPFPPVEEQREIVAELHRMRAVVESTLAALRQQVSLLEEYRQALITSTVTGEAPLPSDWAAEMEEVAS